MSATRSVLVVGEFTGADAGAVTTAAVVAEGAVVAAAVAAVAEGAAVASVVGALTLVGIAGGVELVTTGDVLVAQAASIGSSSETHTARKSVEGIEAFFL